MQLSNIDVSLSHGKLLAKKQLFFLYFGIIICCCFPLLTIILLIIPQVEWEIEIIIFSIISNLGAFALIYVFVYIKRKNDKLIEKIKIWVKDAIILKAYSKSVGKVRMGFAPIATKIQIRFVYNNSTIKKDSTYKVFGGIEGYVSCFNKYADKKIEILYSPTYEEVLILKDNACRVDF